MNKSITKIVIKTSTVFKILISIDIDILVNKFCVSYVVKPTYGLKNVIYNQ